MKRRCLLLGVTDNDKSDIWWSSLRKVIGGRNGRREPTFFSTTSYLYAEGFDELCRVPRVLQEKNLFFLNKSPKLNR